MLLDLVVRAPAACPLSPQSPTLLIDGDGLEVSLPSFPTDSEPPQVLVYSDSDNSYFIRKEVVQLDPDSPQNNYQILLSDHPRVSHWRRVLGQSGIRQLFDLAEQSWSCTTVLDGHTPTNIIDTSRSLTTAAIRFEPDQAKSPSASYNTELFFQVPFLIAHRTAQMAKLSLMAAALNVAACFALIPSYGIQGAAVATVIGFGAQAVAYYH